ncbi:MAG: YoaH family protein [Hydrogenothermaceae bacterium]
MNIKEIKELSMKFTPEQIEKCINETLQHGKPLTEGCNPSGDIVEILNTLAKAQTVRELMEKGMSQTEAIRELARRIREIQSVK